eukprot:98620_1
MSSNNTLVIPKGKLGESLWELEAQIDDPTGDGITYHQLSKNVASKLHLELIPSVHKAIRSALKECKQNGGIMTGLNSNRFLSSAKQKKLKKK